MYLLASLKIDQINNSVSGFSDFSFIFSALNH